MTVDEAIKNLENALKQKWPTDSMDPDAVQIVVDELKRLREHGWNGR